MAKNDVVITLRVDDKGNIKQVGNQSKKAAKDVDKLGKSAGNADRNMKGLSQQSSNSSKNFSKMAQGMSGGLVPAYATLAAQIFAVTALFRFLQQAADYRVLIAGQKAFAAETGIAYNSIARSLQDATDGQLAFKDASQAAAIGSAAGVNPEQLERLATVAKNASIALGRDLTDSFNRLIRGTTKAEPELLDELGIILRLDEATKNYAAQIGKTKEQLTIFEKSQAVTNEVLKQGEGKFGAIGDQVPVNALSQFAKAFDDVLNLLYEFVGPLAERLATFFSKNIVAFIGALTAFAVPIVKLILPSFDAMADKAEENARIHKRAFASQKADLASYQATLASAKAGAGVNRSAFQAQASKMGVNTSGRGKLAAIVHFEQQTTAIEAGELEKRTGLLAAHSKKDVAILRTKYEKMMRDTKGTTTYIQRQFDLIGLRFSAMTQRVKTTWAATMSFVTAVGAKSAKLLNKAFGIVMILSFLAMAYDFVKPYLGIVDKEDPLDDAVKKAKDLNKELDRMAQRFKEKIGSSTGNTLKDALDTLTFGGNMSSSANLKSRLEGYGSANAEGKERLFEGIMNDLQALETVNPAFTNLNETIQNSGSISASAAERINLLVRNMQSGKAAAQQLSSAMADLNKAKNSYITGNTNLPFMDLLTPLGLGATGAAEGANQLESQRDNAKFQARGLRDNVKTGSSRYLGRFGMAQRALDPTGFQDFMDDRSRLRGLDARIQQLDGEISSMRQTGAEFESEGQKYKGFTTRANTALTAKSGLQQDAASITRKDALAQRAIKQNKIDQKGFDIAVQMEKLGIQKKLREEKDVQDNPLRLMQANAAVTQDENKLKLMKAQKEAMEAQLEPLNMIKDASIAAFDQGLQAAILGIIDGTKSMKEGFLDMAKAVLTAIAQIIAKLLAMKALQAIGLPVPGFAFANGGIKPKGYANGGIVSEPTYLAGEGKYNEAVVPLPDGRSIPVMMKGGGGTANVTVNIAADGQASSNMTANNGQQAGELAKAVSAAVQEEMHKQQRPGGILSPYGGG